MQALSFEPAPKEIEMRFANVRVLTLAALCAALSMIAPVDASAQWRGESRDRGGRGDGRVDGARRDGSPRSYGRDDRRGGRGDGRRDAYRGGGYARGGRVIRDDGYGRVVVQQRRDHVQPRYVQPRYVQPHQGRVIVRPVAPRIDVRPWAAPRVVVRRAPPAPRYVQRPVAPWSDAQWIEGYWQWDGTQHTWVEGHWDHARPSQVWVDARWEQRPEGWVFVQGYWASPTY